MPAVSEDYLRTLRALSHNPYDRAAIEQNLVDFLQNAMPGWTAAPGDNLRRALPLIAELLFLHGEQENNNWQQGTLLYAEGQNLDIFGIQRPPILRRLGEADDDYRLRLANSAAGLNIGSLASIEASVIAFDGSVADVQAVTATNRQDVRVYALKAGLTALTGEEVSALLAHLNERGNKIAGVDITVPAVTQTPFTIDVTLRHPPFYAAETLADDARTGIYAWLATVQTIGAAVYQSSLIRATKAPEDVDVTVAAPAADLAATAGTVYVCPSDETNVVIRTTSI